MMIDEHGRCSWQDMSPHFEPTAQERSVQELARWVRGYAGRGQAASLLWTGIGFVCAFFVGTQDAGKQRPYYGPALVVFAHFSWVRRTRASSVPTMDGHWFCLRIFRGYAVRGQAASLLWTGIGFVCAFFV